MASPEEPLVPAEAEPVAESNVAVEPTNEKVPPPTNSKTKKAAAKEPKKKKVAAPRKRSGSTHPTYFEMIKDAIVTLKDRTGSSQPAITKFIEAKHKNLPPNFRKLLFIQLKKLVENGKLVKVKASFKLPPVRSPKPPPQKPKAAAKMKQVTVSRAKPAKSTPVKPKSTAASKSKPPPKAKPLAKAKPTAKTKAAAPAKKAATKRKAPEKPKAEKPPSKVAKRTTRSSPGKKTTTGTAAAKKSLVPKKTAPEKKVPVKKPPPKSVKPKTVKSAAKRASGKKGKK